MIVGLVVNLFTIYAPTPPLLSEQQPAWWFLKLARCCGARPGRLLTSPPSSGLYFFPWTFRWKLCERHMHFFYIGMLCGMWNINTWALAWKITVLSCLCQRGAWMEQLLKGSSAEADGLGQNIFHSISALSEDWDPADQSHKQITINKLNGESQRLENGDERQAFKEERTLNNKQ